VAVILETARLYLGADCDDIETFGIAGGTACVYTHRAPDKDSHNEDSLGLVPCNENAGVLVVADGLGGLPSGDQASSTAVRQLSRNVTATCAVEPMLREAILDAIEQANQMVMAQGVGSGTTFAAVEIDGPAARPYHVGDSEILVTGQRGRIKYQSISHSPVAYAVEAGLLEADDAIYHEERHLVSNVLGSTDMRVEIGPRITLAPRDTLVIASDGLFDNMPIDEIVNIIRVGPLPRAAQNLLEICQARMAQSSDVRPHKPDDIGFILFRPVRREPGGRR
jgi:serine/threonine protein phosphatase PrpC